MSDICQCTTSLVTKYHLESELYDIYIKVVLRKCPNCQKPNVIKVKVSPKLVSALTSESMVSLAGNSDSLSAKATLQSEGKSQDTDGTETEHLPSPPEETGGCRSADLTPPPSLPVKGLDLLATLVASTINVLPAENEPSEQPPEEVDWTDEAERLIAASPIPEAARLRKYNKRPATSPQRPVQKKKKQRWSTKSMADQMALEVAEMKSQLSKISRKRRCISTSSSSSSESDSSSSSSAHPSSDEHDNSAATTQDVMEVTIPSSPDPEQDSDCISLTVTTPERLFIEYGGHQGSTRESPELDRPNILEKLDRSPLPTPMVLDHFEASAEQAYRSARGHGKRFESNLPRQRREPRQHLKQLTRFQTPLACSSKHRSPANRQRDLERRKAKHSQKMKSQSSIIPQRSLPKRTYEKPAPLFTVYDRLGAVMSDIRPETVPKHNFNYQRLGAKK